MKPSTAWFFSICLIALACETPAPSPCPNDKFTIDVSVVSEDGAPIQDAYVVINVPLTRKVTTSLGTYTEHTLRFSEMSKDVRFEDLLQYEQDICVPIPYRVRAYKSGYELAEANFDGLIPPGQITLMLSPTQSSTQSAKIAIVDYELSGRLHHLLVANGLRFDNLTGCLSAQLPERLNDPAHDLAQCRSSSLPNVSRPALQPHQCPALEQYDTLIVGYDATRYLGFAEELYPCRERLHDFILDPQTPKRILLVQQNDSGWIPDLLPEPIELEDEALGNDFAFARPAIEHPLTASTTEALVSEWEFSEPDRRAPQIRCCFEVIKPTSTPTRWQPLFETFDKRDFEQARLRWAAALYTPPVGEGQLVLHNMGFYQASYGDHFDLSAQRYTQQVIGWLRHVR